jgi:site-specific DNA recombinase
MITDSNIKRVAIYTRVSTDEQAEHGFSLDSQLQRLQNFCLAKQWEIVGTYIDGGYSGTNTKRPEYTRMFEQKETWDAILVIKMDRIHRNSKNFLDMMELLAKSNKEFVSMSESLDTSTAMGRFVMNITQNIAQLESEQIGERTYLAMRQKAKTTPGVYNGHFRPYGYDIKNHQLIPDPEKLSVVKKSFELYDQGDSLPQICEKTGLKFCTLQYILHNSIYAGFEQWCYIFKRAPVQPLIGIDLFNRVQKRMVDRNPHSEKKHFRPLQLHDVDSFEIPTAERQFIPMLRCRMPKHKMNY